MLANLVPNGKSIALDSLAGTTDPGTSGRSMWREGRPNRSRLSDAGDQVRLTWLG